jgi:hypothetical protein
VHRFGQRKSLEIAAVVETAVGIQKDLFGFSEYVDVANSREVCIHVSSAEQYQQNN